MGQKFKSVKTCFNGIDGYEVKQITNGKVVSKQFVPEDIYDYFCEQIGFLPESENNTERVKMESCRK